MATSCSGRTETVPSGTTASSPVSEQNLAASLAAAICNNIGPCCALGGYVHDTEICRQTAEAQFTMALADLRAESTAISYDPVEAGRCVAAFANIVKACTDTDDSVEDACDRIYNGTLAAGQPCTDSNECTDPPGGYASCETDLVDGVSRCKTYEDIVSVGARGALGDACATTCTTEPGGQGCSGGIVVGPPGVGGGPTAQPGNAACFTNDGLFCDFTTYLCTALIPIGQPCSSSGCVAGAFCEASVCTAQRTSGSCLQYYDACASTAYCDQTGNCALKKPDGASCTYGDECTGGECTESSVCALASIASQEICSGIVN